MNLVPRLLCGACGPALGQLHQPVQFQEPRRDRRACEAKPGPPKPIVIAQKLIDRSSLALSDQLSQGRPSLTSPDEMQPQYRGYAPQHAPPRAGGGQHVPQRRGGIGTSKMIWLRLRPIPISATPGASILRPDTLRFSLAPGPSPASVSQVELSHSAALRPLTPDSSL